MVRLHLGDRYDQIGSQSRIWKVELRLVSKPSYARYIVPVQIDEQVIESRDQAPVFRFRGQIVSIPPMPRSFADPDLRRAQALEYLKRSGENAHVSVDDCG